MELSFRLDDEFVQKYKDIKPPFGFNGLGELVYRRTYSRKIGDRNEEWYETVRRVVEGTYSIQKDHIEAFRLGWSDEQGQESAQEMYNLIFHMKFLPPGRGLYAMGTEMVHKKGLAAALNNCAFVSTQNIEEDLTKPFEFLMDATMLGVGVGFDTKGANKIKILGPDDSTTEKFTIDDSREGWVESMAILLMSYFGRDNQRGPNIYFDYSKIRPKGRPLKTYGGYSSGPQPLIELHSNLRELLDRNRNKLLSSSCIVDIFNLIGKCVVGVGNIRCAEIAFGDPSDVEFLDLKDYKKNPHRELYGWTSNNSVFADIGMDYSSIVQRIINNGEPGLCWLENMRAFGRMCDPKNNKDIKVAGGNPCLEQSLESYEMCCLVETFPARHDTMNEFLRTLKFAYFYAKTVTLCMTHWPYTNRVILRNRRIGCSVSGIAQFLAKHNTNVLKEWLDKGYNTIQHYDDIYSRWLCIQHSIKTTSVKPSGTVSLLAGATPGIHYPESRYYIRRIRIQNNNIDMINSLKNSGYKIVPCHGIETSSIVEIPVDVGEGVRVIDDVSMFEQFSLAAFMQRYWADNQVSCTVTFNPKTESNNINCCLEHFQYQLKGISLLPRIEYGAYPQMPYEQIDDDEYQNIIKSIKPISWGLENNNIHNDNNNIKTNNINNNNIPKIKTKNKYIGFKIKLNNTNDISSESEDESGLCSYPDSVSYCDSERCDFT